MLALTCRLRAGTILALAVLAVLAVAASGRQGGAVRAQGGGEDKPSLSLRASPRVGFAPAEVLFVAELRGGADDFEDFYCASMEWDWDDDTRSESTLDCDPYEAGESRIRRRFSTRHRFDYGGRYEVRFLLKKRDDTVAAARTVVELRGDRFGRFR